MATRIRMLVLLSLVGCTHGTSAERHDGTASAATSRTDATSAANAIDAPAATVRTLGAEGSIAMLEVSLPVGADHALRHDGCQEALVVVREGTVALDAHRATTPTRDELTVDEAARLPMGATTPSRIVARTPARVFVVYARSLDRTFGPETSLAQITTPPEGCGPGPEGTGPTIARAGTTGPFPQGQGALRAYVHLDLPRHGAGLASLGYLDADATAFVPEHGHEGSAEVLYFESGAGTMRVGERTFPIGPGRFVYVPTGVRHGLVPDGTAPLRALQVYTPSGPEQRFRPTR